MSPVKENNLLRNIFTSGKYSGKGRNVHDPMPDTMVRYVLLNFALIVGSLFLVIFVVENCVREYYFAAAICSVMLALALTIFILARLNLPLLVSGMIYQVSYLVFCFLLIWNGGAEGSGFLYMYLFPPMAILLLGMKMGIILSGIQLALTSVEVLVPGGSLYHYPPVPSLRVLVVYVLVLSLSIVFERTRQIKDQINARLLRELKSLFGRYLPDKVINEMLASPNGPSLGGEKRYLTIMTTDIRGFTSLAEKEEGESVVKLLNHYFSVMVDIIFEFNGTIIEFLGDSILCIFGAPMDDPHHADKAVACALKMQLAMKDVNAWGRGNNFPEIEMGVAINTGEAIVGNIGSDRVMKYNVIGNHVNLSGRIESYTTGGQVMISEYTYNALRSNVTVAQRSKINPKGVSASLFIMRVDAIGEPYNITLDNEKIPLEKLESPIKAMCYPICNKQIGADGFDAWVTHLSPKEGNLRFANGADHFTLFNDLQVQAGDTKILAKVTGVEDGKTIKVRFTTGSGNFRPQT